MSNLVFETIRNKLKTLQDKITNSTLDTIGDIVSESNIELDNILCYLLILKQDPYIQSEEEIIVSQMTILIKNLKELLTLLKEAKDEI